MTLNTQTTLKNKPLDSAQLKHIILSGLKKNEANKVSWRCDFCDKGVLHFHASSVGYCQRKLFYQLTTGMKHRMFAPTETAFLRDGHINETIIREGLKGAGIRMFKHDDNPTPFKKVKDVIMVIHCDIHFEFKGQEYIIEQKSIKPENFRKIVRQEMPLPFWYEDQINIYFDYFEVEKGFILVKSRASSEFLPFPIQRDRKRVAKLYAKCQSILDHVKKEKIIERPKMEGYDPNLTYNKKATECKLCDFYTPCYGI